MPAWCRLGATLWFRCGAVWLQLYRVPVVDQRWLTLGNAALIGQAIGFGGRLVRLGAIVQLEQARTDHAKHLLHIGFFNLRIALVVPYAFRCLQVREWIKVFAERAMPIFTGVCDF